MPRPRRRHRRLRPDLTIAQVLNWADEFLARFGRWPTRTDGRAGLPDTTWSAVDACLKSGSRGLNRGSSLAKLLLERRGRRHKKYLPPLTPPGILAWADAHQARTGEWPGQDSGPVKDAPGETWSGMDCALLEGGRGLPGGSSLAQLLADERGVRNHLALPPLSPGQILGWADQHHARTGEWPKQSSGPVVDAPGETWSGVNAALLVGVRGLPGSSSLARLLQSELGVRNPAAAPRLEHWEVLLWADAYHDRTGRWPTAHSGPIPEAPGETWIAIDSALRLGTRGLPGRDSLARLLARRPGKRNHAALPPLTIEQILGWADSHYRQTGEWPKSTSGRILDAPSETWYGVARALQNGRRGLPGGSSLPQLLEAERGVRNLATVPPLTVGQVLAWADAHHVRTGRWPTAASGPVFGVPGETWSAVSAALETGIRGLPGGESLARLLTDHRGVRNHMALPPLTIEQILAWADAHHARTGEWPTGKGDEIPEAPGETWRAVEMGLSTGLRGLPGGDTLARLLSRHRGKRNRKALPPLSVEQIKKWVEAHVRRTGEWPRRAGGPIPEATGETWTAVDQALYRGLRGLPGGSSLPQVVQECQGAWIRAGQVTANAIS